MMDAGGFEYRSYLEKNLYGLARRYVVVAGPLGLRLRVHARYKLRRQQGSSRLAAVIDAFFWPTD